MACFHPLPAWRSPAGQISLHHQKQKDSIPLQLPCGNCLGCRHQKAQGWALRCQLELQQHENAIFSTLTYNDEQLPLTLQKRDLQLFLKRLRKATRGVLRFFASGEYGETTNRPHYHAIIYGLSEREAPRLEETWKKGHVRTYQATPANIAYTAGYCSKKIGYQRYSHERTDPTTGEVYEWQPAFIQMSRRPGIGAQAKKYLNSWRLYAIKDGHKMHVPRFLHEAYKQHATKEQLEQLAYEKSQLIRHDDLDALEKIATKQQEINADKRRY